MRNLQCFLAVILFFIACNHVAAIGSFLNVNSFPEGLSLHKNRYLFKSFLSLRGGKLGTSKKGVKSSSKKDNKHVVEKQKKVLTKEEESKIISWQKGIMQAHGALMSLGSMYLSRKIMKVDYKNAAILKKVRLVFAAYLVFAQLLYFLLKFLIKLENNKDLVVQAANPVLNSPALIGNPIMKLMGGFGKPKNDIPMTVKQYDLQQNKELFTSLVSEIIGVTVLHLVFKMGAPLLMVPMWGVSNRLKSPLILIRLFGMKPVGQFARPFKSSMEMMMDDMMKGVTASVDVEQDPPTATAVSNTAESPAKLTAASSDERSKMKTKVSDNGKKVNSSAVLKENAKKSSAEKNTAPKIEEEVEEEIEEEEESIEFDETSEEVVTDNQDEDIIELSDDYDVNDEGETDLPTSKSLSSKVTAAPAVATKPVSTSPSKTVSTSTEIASTNKPTQKSVSTNDQKQRRSSQVQKKKSKDLALELEAKMNELMDDLDKPILPSSFSSQTTQENSSSSDE